MSRSSLLTRGSEWRSQVRNLTRTIECFTRQTICFLKKVNDTCSFHIKRENFFGLGVLACFQPPYIDCFFSVTGPAVLRHSGTYVQELLLFFF